MPKVKIPKKIAGVKIPKKARKKAKKAIEVVKAAEAPASPRFDRRNLGWVIAALLGGILIGVVGLLAYAWVKVPG